MQPFWCGIHVRTRDKTTPEQREAKNAEMVQKARRQQAHLDKMTQT